MTTNLGKSYKILNEFLKSQMKEDLVLLNIMITKKFLLKILIATYLNQR